MSKLILGTVQLGLDYGINNSKGKPSKEEAFAILKKAAESGIGFLDTASAYGDSENIIGEFNQAHPKINFKVLTKFQFSGKTTFADQVKSSFKELKTDKLYSLSCHDFMEATDKELFNEMISLKQNGKTEKIGVSIYDNSDFEKAIKNKEIDIIQIPFNLLDNWDKRGDLILKAKRAGKEIHIRSIFLQGLFFKDVQELPEKLDQLEKPILKIQAISKEKGISVDTLALHYAMSFPQIDKILVGVDNVDQLKAIILSEKSFTEGKNMSSLDIDVDSELIDPRSW